MVKPKTDGVDIVYADDMNNLDPLTLASAIYVTGFTGTRIQNAINAIPSAGGKMVMRAGSYSLSTVLNIQNRNHLIIEGMGQGAYSPRPATNLVWNGAINSVMLDCRGARRCGSPRRARRGVEAL